VAAVDSRGGFDLIIGMNIINRGDFRLRLVDDKTIMTFNLLQEDTPQQKK
jgi:hypothetical protein